MFCFVANTRHQSHISSEIIGKGFFLFDLVI